MCNIYFTGSDFSAYEKSNEIQYPNTHFTSNRNKTPNKVYRNYVGNINDNSGSSDDIKVGRLPSHSGILRLDRL